MPNTIFRKGVPSTWKLEGEKPISDCKVFKTVARRFSHPDGRRDDFYINLCSDWVQVAALAKNESGKLCAVMVNQFRFGVQKTSWEFPGGVMEYGESPQEAAKRELLEETGYGSESAGEISSFSPNPAIQNNLAHFVVMENCKKQGAFLTGLLKDLMPKHACIKEVRGKGLMVGVVLDYPAVELLPILRSKGMIALTAGETVLRLVPPLIVTEDDCRKAAALIDAAISEHDGAAK